jgi:hypothetical protein
VESLSGLFRQAFKSGLSGFSFKREDPKAPIRFQLEPQTIYDLCEAHPETRARGTCVAAYLLPSLIFVMAAVLIEAWLPTAFVYSDLLARIVAASEAILLGAILFETLRVFHGSLGHGTRYVVLASLTTMALTLAAWPNAAILLVSAVYAGLHSRFDARLQARDKLRVHPLVTLVPLALVVLGSWGSPWTGLALLGDVWSDDALSGQLARSCLWAAFGPSVLPVLVLHLSYAKAQWAGLALTSVGLFLIYFLLADGRPRRASSAEYVWISKAFYAGFIPSLALLTIGALSTWPTNIQWEALHFWIVVLGFALRARGWDLKILVSLALAILSLQTIVERL